MISSILRDWTSVLALKSDWNELLELSDAHKLFFSWEWIESWIDIVKEDISPYFITVRDDKDKLVGIAPFYKINSKLLGLINYKTLRIAADHSTGFEYSDFIVNREHHNEILKAIGSALHRDQSQWDLIWLPKVAGWTDSLNRIKTATADSFSFPFNTRLTDFSSINLPATMDEYDNTFSSKRRNQHKRTHKRVFRESNTSFVSCTKQEELPHYLDTLFSLHHKRRMLVNDPGTFIRRPSQVPFYKNFTPKALKKGWLRINAIESKGEIQAIQLGYVCNGSYMQMQEGFNPDFIKGAGNALRRHTICLCIGDGLREYDFLGGVTEHKRRWGAKKRTGSDILIGSHKLKSRLIIKLNAWPTGKYLKQKGLID